MLVAAVFQIRLKRRSKIHSNKIAQDTIRIPIFMPSSCRGSPLCQRVVFCATVKELPKTIDLPNNSAGLPLRQIAIGPPLKLIDEGFRSVNAQLSYLLLHRCSFVLPIFLFDVYGRRINPTGALCPTSVLFGFVRSKHGGCHFRFQLHCIAADLFSRTVFCVLEQLFPSLFA